MVFIPKLLLSVIYGGKSFKLQYQGKKCVRPLAEKNTITVIGLKRSKTYETLIIYNTTGENLNW